MKAPKTKLSPTIKLPTKPMTDKIFELMHGGIHWTKNAIAFCSYFLVILVLSLSLAITLSTLSNNSLFFFIYIYNIIMPI